MGVGVQPGARVITTFRIGQRKVGAEKIEMLAAIPPYRYP
jgi:hypothetical protein